MPKEVELKLQIKDPEQDVIRILESQMCGIEIRPVHLRNLYYDTQDFQLHRAQIALRIRKVNNDYIQSLKTKGTASEGLHIRGEWEWPLEGESLNLYALKNCEAWPLLNSTCSLEKVFETNFTRYQAVVSWEGAKLELAIDRGQVSTGAKMAPLNEIEIELISGSVNNIISFRDYIRQFVLLEESDISKAERGYFLCRS